jgi:hypothetical protein
LWQRYDPQTRQLVAANLERINDYDEPEICTNWKTDVRSLADVHFCGLGSQSPHKIIFWGDSHVGQLYPAIEELYNKGELLNRGVVMAIGAGCLPDKHLNHVSEGYHCDSFSKFALLRAKKEDIDTVFIGFSTWAMLDDDSACVSSDGKCLTMLSKEQLRRRFLSDLSDEIITLHALGKKVIVSLPFPIFNGLIPEVEISNAVFGRFGLIRTAEEIALPSFHQEVRAVAVSAGAEIFDPRLTLCQGQECLTQMHGVSIYKDNSHIAGSQAGILESNLREVLQGAMRN